MPVKIALMRDATCGQQNRHDAKADDFYHFTALFQKLCHTIVTRFTPVCNLFVTRYLGEMINGSKKQRSLARTTIPAAGLATAPFVGRPSRSARNSSPATTLPGLARMTGTGGAGGFRNCSTG
jgi:hypothetical protein